jgi:hypothetical protein
MRLVVEALMANVTKPMPRSAAVSQRSRTPSCVEDVEVSIGDIYS